MPLTGYEPKLVIEMMPCFVPQCEGGMPGIAGMKPPPSDPALLPEATQGWPANVFVETSGHSTVSLLSSSQLCGTRTLMGWCIAPQSLHKVMHV